MSTIELKLRTTKSFYLHLPKLWHSYYKIHNKYSPILRAAASATRLIGNQIKGRRILKAKWYS